jgi:hypothetical protein
MAAGDLRARRRLMTVDAHRFNQNVNAFPPEELMRYAGQWIAWNSEGTAILAGSGQSQEALLEELRRAGHDPARCVFDYIPRPDEVSLGTFSDAP